MQPLLKSYKLLAELCKPVYSGRLTFAYMKVKAIFFLFVFMLNTLIGFGCSITMESEGHEHGHKHHAHHLETGIDLSKHLNLKITEKEDSCCKNLVNDFLGQGKLLPDYVKVNLKVPALIPVGFSFAFIPEIEIIIADQQEVDQHLYRPPHPDIRISIQSFQI